MFDKIKEAHKSLIATIADAEANEEVVLQAKTEFETAIETAKQTYQTDLKAAMDSTDLKVAELSDQVKTLSEKAETLDADIKSLNEAAENDRATIKELHEENDALTVRTGELEADVETAKEANKILAETTGEEHQETNANPNSKIVEGEPLTSGELWARAEAKARAAQN